MPFFSYHIYLYIYKKKKHTCVLIYKFFKIFPFFSLISFKWSMITYNFVIVLAIHWNESAMGARVSPHPEPASHFPPHPIPLGCPRALALSALLHASNLHWSSYFTYGNMHVSLLFSEITLAFSHLVQKSVLYICVSFAVSHIGLSLPSL